MHIEIRNWFVRTRSQWEQDGLVGLAWALYHFYLGFWISFTSRFPLGTNVFERDWDVLIILDACRVDAMEEVAGEYDFINSVGSMYSVGSTSSEWIAKTFTDPHREKIGKTSYVTGNPFAELILQRQQLPPNTDASSIGFPVPVCSRDWKTLTEEDLFELYIIEEYSDERDFVKPRPITERAICVGRSGEGGKLIVHYMQPHLPYTGEDLPRELRGTTISRKLMNNEVSVSQVWEAYLNTLRYVLDEVELLLENIEAETVAITADHGEGFGEHATYSHNFGWLHPVVKRVPWIETTATDTGQYVISDESDQEDRESTSIKKRLSNLGYIDD